MAELDQKGFWKAIKSKKKGKKDTSNGKEIRFKDIIEKHPDRILEGWCNYFSDLYSFSVDNCFDDTFRQQIEQEVNNKTSTDENNYTSQCLTNPISIAEMNKIIRNLQNGKSASYDNITYEHIKYGGETLVVHITNLFNAILKTEEIPKLFKEGITITLHKGSSKSTLDPNNYRAISLLPVISKLFEKLMLVRIETKTNIQNSLNPLQHGFMKGKSSKMVSFVYQETVNYTFERSQVLFTCFLDAMKAFDRSWISGIIYLLFDLGLQGKALRVFNNMLRGCSSGVYAFGHLSSRFIIQQGTRQGSIWSPFLYTVLIDGLLKQLDDSKSGLKINGISLCAPTQADDIVLMSLTKNGLNELLQLCNEYANKWRFSYNASKCAVLLHN